MFVAALTLTISQQWTLVCGGDLMLNQVPYKRDPLSGIAPILRAANLAIANLESPLTTQHEATHRKSPKELLERTQFLLRANPRFASMLAADGIRLVGMANNHCMDYGGAGLAESTRALDAARIGHAGASTTATLSGSPVVFTLPSGKRVGLICALAFVTTPALLKCTPATATKPGVAVLNFGGKIDERARKKLRAMVASAKRACDFLIVGLHWGVERKKMPIPYQVQLARAFIDAGADMIWGHHPHVLQGAELYKGRPVLYSIGNLISAIPAETALFRLRFNGNILIGMDVLPCTIRNCTVRPTSKPKSSIVELSRDLQKRYPSKMSRMWSSN